MKTVKYRGKEYEVADCVNFLAKDSDGQIWGFENEPFLNDYGDWATASTEEFMYSHTEYVDTISPTECVRV